MSVNEFVEQTFPDFEKMLENGITDLFFLYVESDRIFMKKYLDTVASVGDLRQVNNSIAQCIAKTFDLKNSGEECNSPLSNLIQSYSKLKN